MNKLLKIIGKFAKSESLSDVDSLAVRDEILRLGQLLDQLDKSTEIKDYSSDPIETNSVEKPSRILFLA